MADYLIMRISQRLKKKPMEKEFGHDVLTQYLDDLHEYSWDKLTFEKKRAALQRLLQVTKRRSKSRMVLEISKDSNVTVVHSTQRTC